MPYKAPLYVLTDNEPQFVSKILEPLALFSEKESHHSRLSPAAKFAGETL